MMKLGAYLQAYKKGLNTKQTKIGMAPQGRLLFIEKEVITRLQKIFEDYARETEGIEFWFARDLQVLLGYVEWRKFQGVIEKAKDACKNSNHDVHDHFVGSDKMVQLG